MLNEPCRHLQSKAHEVGWEAHFGRFTGYYWTRRVCTIFAFFLKKRPKKSLQAALRSGAMTLSCLFFHPTRSSHSGRALLGEKKMRFTSVVMATGPLGDDHLHIRAQVLNPGCLRSTLTRFTFALVPPPSTPSQKQTKCL